MPHPRIALFILKVRKPDKTLQCPTSHSQVVEGISQQALFQNMESHTSSTRLAGTISD
jgi:hypothetical protein